LTLKVWWGYRSTSVLFWFWIDLVGFILCDDEEFGNTTEFGGVLKQLAVLLQFINSVVFFSCEGTHQCSNPYSYS